ncbi:hypothetical protein [Gordonia rubripertincta]|uniref:Uncharacterized protein n=1 Tax=Gordonia rubripertincta TaxID=36822 RepID=A0ABT4MS68_GORRU|nr:hypothetical protein [Gordonia rubripertincta]MCZ4548572.1 hypothetical protein [Gordonia rubripertincta]
MLCCTILLLLMVGLRKLFVIASCTGREVSPATAMPPAARRVVTTDEPVSAGFGR